MELLERQARDRMEAHDSLEFENKRLRKKVEEMTAQATARTRLF